jgi:hypothetical protein
MSSRASALQGALASQRRLGLNTQGCPKDWISSGFLASQEVAAVPFDLRSGSAAGIFQPFVFLSFGCSAQTWIANSLSRWRSKISFISSSEFPASGPEGLNTHAHSEQPRPAKCEFSIDTRLRNVVTLACPREV